jgi:hypothetical protein
MTGVIFMEREALSPNPLGAVFFGPSRDQLTKVDKLGLYSAAWGDGSSEVTVDLIEREDGLGLMLLLPFLHTLWIRVDEYKTRKTEERELLGKQDGLYVAGYQIESLGGRLSFLKNKVRIYSWESIQENSK